MIGPLSGIKVLDLTSYLAGPYGCALLGDLGADVIKVEPLNGEMMRNYPSTLESESRAFVGANRNKRGMALNLKAPEGLAILQRLVTDADVLVENFRPDVPARLGIDYPRLRTVNPRLIYCALTGYGDDGPLRDQPGFDQVLQSMSGIAYYQGHTTGTPQIVLGSIVDYYASVLVAYGTAAALYHREKTSVGEYLSLSLLRTAITMQAGRFVWAQGEGANVDRDLRPGRTAGIHPTKEGFIYISAHSAHFWHALCEILGVPQLAEDSRYDDMRKRAERADELLPVIHAALKAHTAEEWERLLSDKVPCAVVRRIEDMFDHPQVLAENLVTTVNHPVIGKYRTMTKPIHFTDAPGPETRPAPTLGQHSEEILTQCGFDADFISAMRVKGVIC